MSNKFTSLHKDVFSVFDSASWKSEGILTYPANYAEIKKTAIRLNVVASEDAINTLSCSGLILIDIFTAAGEGPMAAMQIADRLDAYLVGKCIKSTTDGYTQLGKSTLIKLGIDTDNPTLYRHQYSITFNFFGT